MFEEELTPEDLFRQFFGGGGAFGGPFGTSARHDRLQPLGQVIDFELTR